jgi:O-antigen/teichoic acid export membrane protein
MASVSRRMGPPDVSTTGATRRHLGLAVASVGATGLTWVLQAVAGRVLGPEAYAALMVVWGMVFFEIGTLLGLQQEVTRAVASGKRTMPGTAATTDSGRRTSVASLGLVVGCATGFCWLATSPLWGAHLWGNSWLVVTCAMAIGAVGYSMFAVVNGVLAGRDQWTDYAYALANDSAVRLVLLLGVISLGLGLPGQSWALNGAALAWLLLVVRRNVRAAGRARVDDSLKSLAGGALQAMVASACSAAVIAGFPVLLKFTSSEPLGRQDGILLAAVIATRGPLLLPLSAFQAILLTRFVLDRDSVTVVLRRLLALLTGVTACGMGGAYLVGPLLLRLLYGDQFRIPPGPLALLVLAAGLIAAQTLTGVALMAEGRHRAFAASWLASVVVVVALLSLDLAVNARATLALNVGPLVGMTINLAALASHRRHRPRSTSILS